MATTTAKSANRANENKNAAAAAASVETKQSATSTTRKRAPLSERIVIAGVPRPADKPAEKPETVTSANTVQAAPQPAPAQEAKPATKPAEPTAEERAAALQREIEERTKQLQAALTDLARKKELNDHRTKFLKTLDDLRASEEQLNKADDFDGNEPCKIAFQGKPDGYRWDNIFTIGNAELQKDFIKFIREKIRAKVEEIEAELIK